MFTFSPVAQCNLNWFTVVVWNSSLKLKQPLGSHCSPSVTLLIETFLIRTSCSALDYWSLGALRQLYLGDAEGGKRESTWFIECPLVGWPTRSLRRWRKYLISPTYIRAVSTHFSGLALIVWPIAPLIALEWLHSLQVVCHSFAFLSSTHSSGNTSGQRREKSWKGEKLTKRQLKDHCHSITFTVFFLLHWTRTGFLFISAIFLSSLSHAVRWKSI